MPRVLAISGSPSPTSRTTALLRHVGHRVAADGHDLRHLTLRDLPAAPLLHADTGHPAIREVLRAIERSDALIVGTPIYKASYSGLLKTLLDLLPQHALAGKTVLPLATGGSPAHVLALDYAVRPVLTALGTDRVLHGWFVLDQHLTQRDEGGLAIAPEAVGGIRRSVDRLLAALGPSARPGSTGRSPARDGGLDGAGRQLAVTG
ncbi:FMN reductase (NADPH) [Streptomyces sp. AJS327]|uniref:NADPH-dependent FMN reductase n=1 Tax=Streptomyces sp. AJS327 TaxID=2545265 RepID=UPI0015DE3422|nr:NADPH-dependent FMN reductase [Streptomyces sp. AJS327]MBA0053394.1 FMN reductase (NADPH) [Streptomyces sp. AJS327]